MQFQQTKAFILDKLKNELPAHLSYHSMAHVIDVYQAAENIGKQENISEYDMQLLLTAVLFHDSGFINGPKKHEEESCKIANQYLPGYDYSVKEIEKINGMIMATQIPQLPKNHLEEIICDADLDYLGRDDFFPISDSLYKEFNIAGMIGNENNWNKLQVTFFEAHHFFTNTALKLRQKKKDENLALVKLKTVNSEW
jgi:uncharacterized protein